jgi:hypothetical protein
MREYKMARYRKPRPNAQERMAKRNLEAISLEVPIKSRSYSMVKTTERYRFGRVSIEKQIRNGNAWNKAEVKFSRYLGKGRNITTVTSAFGEHYE